MKMKGLIIAVVVIAILAILVMRSYNKMNVDEHQQVAAKYGIRNIPTMILFRDGKEVERIIGVKQKDYIISSIDKARQ